MIQAFGKMFLPGPTEVPVDVLVAQVGAMIGHRTPEMEALMERIQPVLKSVFRTERPVYIAPSSGTGMMEAGVRNGARRSVLSLVNGAFSERFAKIAESNGLEVQRLEVPWGEAHTPEMVTERLARRPVDAVTICHSETSTGVLNPIRELVAAAHEAGDVVVLVDSVSGLAGAPVETDAWGIDYILTASQKALALPPGLGLAVAAESFLDRAREKPDRGYYFDFLAFEKNVAKNQTPNTPAVSLLYALAAQAERIAREGVEARWARHAAMAGRTYAWVDDMRAEGRGIGILAAEGARSPTVTCVTLPEHRTGPEVVAAARRNGYTLAPGYGKLKESTIRIGHMGEQTVDTLEGLLDTLTEVLA